MLLAEHNNRFNVSRMLGFFWILYVLQTLLSKALCLYLSHSYIVLDIFTRTNVLSNILSQLLGFCYTSIGIDKLWYNFD